MRTSRQPAYALATILILLGVAMFSGAAIVTTSTLESKISVSQREGVDAFYVAEAGINDAIWKLHHNDASCNSCSTSLQAGTLNVTYTATGFPQSGQSFTVTMVSTSGQPTGNATITSVGKVVTGNFTAQRQIVANVYQGPADSSIGTTAILGGGSVSVTNGTSHLRINAGDFYANGTITLNSSNVDMNGRSFLTQGNYNTSNQTVVTGSGGVQASNYLPLPSTIAVPTFDFAYYETHNNAQYTANQFQTLVSNAGATVNLPGPVTVIDGNVNMNSWAKNKVINVTGMLIINNGSLSMGNLGNSFRLNISDPGNGKSGLFVSQNVNVNDGQITIDGVFYTPASMSLNDSKPITVTGALIAGSTININTQADVVLTYDSSSVVATLGGTPAAVITHHLEEQY